MTNEKGERKSLVNFLALPDSCVNILFLVFVGMTAGHSVCWNDVLADYGMTWGRHADEVVKEGISRGDRPMQRFYTGKKSTVFKETEGMHWNE